MKSGDITLVIQIIDNCILPKRFWKRLQYDLFQTAGDRDKDKGGDGGEAKKEII